MTHVIDSDEDIEFSGGQKTQNLEESLDTQFLAWSQLAWP